MVSQGWEEDIKLPPGSNPGAQTTETNDDATPNDDTNEHAATAGPSAIAWYEEWCRDPNSGGLAVVESAMADGTNSGTVESEDPQSFLEKQLKILEAFKAKADKPSTPSANAAPRRLDMPDETSINDHIGPVQFNMGGIQVDADDMLQRLKVITNLNVLTIQAWLTLNRRTVTRALRPLSQRQQRRKHSIAWLRTLITSSCKTSSVDS